MLHVAAICSQVNGNLLAALELNLLQQNTVKLAEIGQVSSYFATVSKQQYRLQRTFLSQIDLALI